MLAKYRRKGSAFSFKKTLFALKLITHGRISNERNKELLMKRFFMYNALYRVGRKQKRYKAQTPGKSVFFFFRKFSHYKNPQGLISIFKVAFFLASKKKKTFDIVNSLFMNDRTFSGYLVKLYSQEKVKTIPSKKTFFFNFAKKKLNAYKAARETHWSFFMKGKKLNKRRYGSYIKKYMKTGIKFTHTLLFMLINKFKLSFSFWESFFFVYRESYSPSNGGARKIYQLPIHKYF